MQDEAKNRKEFQEEVRELRRQLADLEESEERYRRAVKAWRDLWAQYEAIIEAFDGFIYICSQNFEVEFMNQRFIERTGYYPLGQKCYKALHDLETVCPWCVNDRVFRGETVRWEVLSPKDNHWYYVVNTPIRHPDGTMSKMAMIQDITDRKEAEESLARAARALKTLSAGDHALVHAKDESSFLEEICRLVVEVGGYRLAWVGFALEDESRTVLPVAQAGFEEGYLQTVKITWADTARGRGPTGTAIRTGKTAIVKKITTDPAFAPWRGEALKRGYESSIALPLRGDDRILGALNIYAREPDAFDAEEVELLEELANEVAYGLTTLRLRAAHKQMEAALRQAEAKYRGIFENAVEGIFQSTPDGRFVSLNPALAKMFGYGSPEEMAAKITDITHQFYVDPQERDKLRKKLEKSGVVKGFRTRVYRKDGSIMEISVNARAVKDESGAVQYYEGFVQEVAERKGAEE
jgi:PAS domain S-box-containing protein